eukprot:CAMPEP_0194407682 /NCGR_PEP_ID=MMETSP0176-20130528/5671_1 /TAXON_ID=216777 /ORGANISM="Proboscia alata, Strain PI-D3" /LENGTH=313 /DNA_ID=CAMNT_0039207423 /DNA_START=166 /DNA_END=1107 /DNA_ORIENTATION=+
MSYDDEEFHELTPEASEGIDQNPSQESGTGLHPSDRVRSLRANRKVWRYILLIITAIVVLSMAMSSILYKWSKDNAPMRVVSCGQGSDGSGGGGDDDGIQGPVQHAANESSEVRRVRVLVQNLQKIPALATELMEEYKPDVMLAQEINFYSETNLGGFSVINISSMGYGTAIISNEQITDVNKVHAPHPDFFFVKKTIIARTKNIQFVSFHGYNGQPFKNVDKLVDHVQAILSVLCPGPTVFAGDFNTWSQGHLDAVKGVMEENGFRHAYTWPYPGRDSPLDHAFLRGVTLENSTHYESASDHFGAILDLSYD